MSSSASRVQALSCASAQICRDENPGILEVFAAAGLQLQPLTLT